MEEKKEVPWSYFDMTIHTFKQREYSKNLTTLNQATQWLLFHQRHSVAKCENFIFPDHLGSTGSNMGSQCTPIESPPVTKILSIVKWVTIFGLVTWLFKEIRKREKYIFQILSLLAGRTSDKWPYLCGWRLVGGWKQGFQGAWWWGIKAMPVSFWTWPESCAKWL